MNHTFCDTCTLGKESFQRGRVEISDASCLVDLSHADSTSRTPKRSLFGFIVAVVVIDSTLLGVLVGSRLATELAFLMALRERT